MDSLHKTPQLSNHAAVMTVLVATYIAATITTAANYGVIWSVLSALLVILMVAISFMTLLFVLSRLFGRMDIVDLGWPLVFIVIAFASLTLGNSNALSVLNAQRIVLLLVCIWSVRLGYHILRRLMHRPEDKRYRKLRQKWKGNEAVNAYVRVFLPQAVLATVVSASVIIINLSPSEPLSTWVLVGVVVWLVGFGFEAIGDGQLRRHLAKNSRVLMTSGLWKYTRHPNYFGESLQWWGIFAVALTTQFGWVGVISPGVITFLLLFVSGVPLAERAFAGRPGWVAYKNRTSMFLPLPPRKV